jgi:hypothetical protein
MNKPVGSNDAAAASEKSRPVRKKVLWSARVRSAIGERQCTIFNLSRGGALIRLDATLDRCANVELMIPGIGKLPGWVVWSSYDRAGIQFSDLSESEAAALEQALRGNRGGALRPVP